MKNIIIISAGNFGREVLSWIKDCPDFINGDWKIKGFLDGRANILAEFNYEEKIIGNCDDYIPHEADLFVCAIGGVADKKAYIQKIINKGGKFVNVIHPSVIMGENVKLGTGVILCPYVILTCDITIGNYVTLNIHSNVGHDSTIGDYTIISPSCVINGHVKIGESVFIGSCSIFIPDSIVENNAVIGAGSLVLKKVLENEVFIQLRQRKQ